MVLAHSEHSPQANSHLPSTFSFHNWFSRLKVGHKISLGYAAALGLAVGGTLFGVILGELYHEPAVEKEEQSQEENLIINQLHKSFLENQVDQAAIIAVIPRSPSELKSISVHLLKNATSLNKIWSELEEFSEEDKTQKFDADAADLTSFVRTYEPFIEDYLPQVESLVKQLKDLNLQSPSEIAAAQKLLENFSNESSVQGFAKISTKMNELEVDSLEEIEESEKFQEEVAEVRLVIIMVSMAISVVIAALLAYFTTRAIAHPLQSVTRIADETIQTANFDLQAPVTTQDEVGILTTAVNQLIRGVKKLLQERKDAESWLVQTEKMSSLGQMVAGVAHEINNPVNFIHGNLTHIKKHIADMVELVECFQQHYPNPPAELQAAIKRIEPDYLKQDLTKIIGSMTVGTERIREIVTALRNFSRLDESDFKAVDIHEGIESTLMLLQSRLNGSAAIAITKNYTDLPLVECYPGQLNQVFMNILSNAIDAIYQQSSSPGMIKIRTAVEEYQIAIHIIDNGMGMNEEVRSKIFDPFFTTKEVGQGTGLGLSISYQIITQTHGGKLSCISTPGQGAEFIIQIPIAQQSR
jgi:two-component system, NtrC family, sensor kinase